MTALFVILLVIVFIAAGASRPSPARRSSGGTDHSSYDSGGSHSLGCDSGGGLGGGCGGDGGA